MADNITLDSGTGGAVLAADDISSVWYQIVKHAFGPLNTATLVTATVGLPVDAIKVVPGTGATNLGKAIDTAVGATDTGVAALAKHKEDLVHLVTADDDYNVLSLDSLGQLHVNAEGHHIFDEMDVTTDWAVLNDDAANLATTKKHALGTDALIFDKVDGSGTVFAIIDKTITAVDLGDISPHDLIQVVCYIPNIDDLAYVLVRLGTDDTNYNEWRIPDTAITADEFEILAFNIGDVDHGGITGNGWDPSAITYIAVGAAFDGEDDTLVGIIFDELSYHTNQHTSAELNAEVTSSVSTANVNLQKIGGSVVTKGAGNVANGSQRVVLATDDVNTAAIKTATETVAAAVSTQMQVDVVAALPAGTNAIGKLAANTGVVIGDVNLGAVDNAVLDTIDAVLDLINAKLVTGTVIGDVNLGATDNAVLDSIVTNQSARATGGCKMFNDIDLDEADIDVATGACTVYAIYVVNTTAGILHLKLFNTNTVTMGTTNADASLAIPANADSDGAGFVLAIPPVGVAFDTALTVAVTTAAALDDNGAPGAGAAIATILFQD